MKTRFALLALALPFSLAAQGPPQQHPGGPMTNAFAARYAGQYRNLAAAFDSIPADKYSYKPTPAQQTIGYVAQHLASDNYFFCSNFGDKKPTRAVEDTATSADVKATWPKDKLVAQLKASIAFCQEALAGVTDASLAGTYTMTARDGQTRQVPRMNAFVGHAIDMADHYSQIANYMRLNGMLPPSALPRPQRPGGN